MQASAPQAGAGALSLSDAALDQLFASDLPVGLAVLDGELRYRRINHMLSAFNGVPPEQALGRSVSEVLPEAWPQLEPLLRRVLEAGEPLLGFEVLLEVPSRPGELSQWEASYLPIPDGAGNVQGVLVQAVNMSLQQDAERQLRTSAARLRRVLDSLFAFVGVLDVNGIVLEANRAPLEAAGISFEEVHGRPFWEAYWWSYDPAMQHWLREAVRIAAQGQVVRQDVVVRVRDDARITIDFMLAPMLDDEGRVQHLVPSGIDVSDRVAGERALRASEARFRSVFEAAPDGMTLVDEQGRMLLANRAMGRLFGSEAGELLGSRIDRLVPAADRPAHADHIRSYFADAQPRLMGKRKRLQGLRADGSLFNIEVGLNPIPGSEPPEVLATVVDIDDRLAAQAQLERALKEKTALLNEVHHRVKNNLQIVSSLLRLQSRHVDEPVRAVLRESQSRVKAMALTHQLLYERSDFSALELGPYLHRLAALLREAYMEPGKDIAMQLDLPGEGLSISLQAAVPCGLIVNELVTNALKHAFTQRSQGLIRVRAARDAQGWFEIEVADDGLGMKALPDHDQCATLGYQLIPLLADQLEARLALVEGPGTCIRIQFRQPGSAA
ncbi:PAS domain S-box protein [Roseateles sp. DB2]|uniref:PAS domain S-box protein n=1 Tax=Roseateles sp. DB2 TaxID=3453717 RepID=UPI003EE85D34